MLIKERSPDSMKRIGNKREPKRSRGLHGHLGTDLQRRSSNDTVTIQLRSLRMLSFRRSEARTPARVFEEHRMVFQWIVTESWVRSLTIAGVNQALGALLSERRRCSTMTLCRGVQATWISPFAIGFLRFVSSWRRSRRKVKGKGWQS